MASVTLVGPRRLNIGGVLYKRGEPVDMEDELAIQFEEDERFRVKGIRLDPDERRQRVAAKESRPMGDNLLRAISGAISELDVDDDDAFDRNGKPSVRSIGAILGYTITVQERDRALSQAQGKGHLDTLDQPANGPQSMRGGKLRLTPEQKAELAKKAGDVNAQLPNGNDKAVERAAIETEDEPALEM